MSTNGMAEVIVVAVGYPESFAWRLSETSYKAIINPSPEIWVNEAFAPQYLAVAKELGLNNDISNMNGGAIALGHPLAASGARITGHLAHELHRQKKRFAMGSACIGGGQGMTVILEKC